MTASQTLKVALLTGILLASSVCPALTRVHKWTIDQRRAEQRKWISDGFKAGELSDKQVEALTKDEDSNATREEKMKDKNNGMLDLKDRAKLEKELNSLSLKIQKLRLEKRVAPVPH